MGFTGTPIAETYQTFGDEIDRYTMDQAVSVGGAFYNLGIVTLGNIIGGAIMVAVPYYFASRKDPVE